MFLLAIGKWVLGWFTGGGLSALVAAYSKAKDSQVAEDQIKAGILEKQIDAKLEHAKLATQIRLATAGFWEMRLLTFLIALPFVVHVLEVGADTCFKLKLKIPAFPEPFDSWEGSILLSFFGIYTAGKAITTIGAAILARR